MSQEGGNSFSFDPDAEPAFPSGITLEPIMFTKDVGKDQLTLEWYKWVPGRGFVKPESSEQAGD